MDLDRGLDLARTLQEGLAWAVPLSLAFTRLGDEVFYVLVFPWVYWCLNPRLGLRLGVVLLLSSGINAVLKLWWAAPRPGFLDPTLARVEHGSFGLPSGHAQNAIAVWGLAAAWTGKAWALAGAAALAVGIGLSRIHLGAHFPVDVVAGWAIGLALLGLYLLVEPGLSRWLGARAAWVQIAAGLFTAGALVAAALAARGALGDWQPPAAWVGLEAEPGPVRLSAAVSAAAALLGLAVGAAWIGRRGGFSAAGPPAAHLLRYLPGIVGVLAIWSATAALAGEGQDAGSLAIRAAGYGLLGLWIGGLAPLLFRGLGLASAAPSPPGLTPRSP